MSWSKTYTRTSEPKPYDSVLFCGICGVEIDVTRAGAYREWDDLTLERKCERHLAEHHALRYWLWQRLGWRWLVGGLAP